MNSPTFDVPDHAPAPEVELFRLGTKPPLGRYLRDALDRRDFLITTVLGEVRSRHVNTALGNVWHLLNPLLLTGVYFLIFGIVFGARDAHPNYIGFLVIGVFVFTFTRKTVVSGASVIVNNTDLIQNIYFPRLLLPLSAAMAEAYAHGAAILVMIATMLATGEPITWQWLLMVPATLLQIGFNVGLALVAARLTTHFRDFENLAPFILRIWFYCSAVLYSLDRLGKALGSTAETAFSLNPAYVYIKIMRDALLDEHVSLKFWALAFAWSLGTLGLALLWFRGREAEYANV